MTENNVILLTWQVPVSSKAPEAFRLFAELGTTDAIDLHHSAIIDRDADGAFVLTDEDGQPVTVADGPLRDLLDALDGPVAGVIEDPASLPANDREGAYGPNDWKSLTEVTVRVKPGRPGVIAHATINSREHIDNIVNATGSSVVRIHAQELHREINAVNAAVDEAAQPAASDQPHESLADRAHDLVDKLKNKLH